MSDEETQILQTTEGKVLTAEYKDGQLEIVEVTPFDKEESQHIIPDLSTCDQTKYLQVLDTSKGLVHLDLLNFTLVKCPDGDESTYQVVGTSSSDDGDTTLTCVYDDEDNEIDGDSFVMVNSEDGQEPLVFLQSSLQQINTQQNLRKKDEPKKSLTPMEILDKAKALQKAKAALRSPAPRRGRRRKSDLPPPMELLSSPNFKLYLYSCKLCNYKCNAVKEMSKHKASEHGAGRGRGVGRSAVSSTLQCARCPFRGSVHSQLMKHVQDEHLTERVEICSSEIRLDSDDLSDADVLVCGACGFESGERLVFRRHIERHHGVNVTLQAATISIETDDGAH